MKRAQRIERQRLYHLRFGLLVMSALLPGLAARGQEALRSALATDQSTKLPESTGESSFASVKLGPLLGHLSLYGSAEYNDNIQATETNPKSDEIITLGFDASFIMPVGTRSQLSLNLGLDYATYLQHTSDSTLGITPDSALTWNITFPNGYLTLFDALSYTSQIYNEGAYANITELPRWDNTLGTRITWSPNHWIIQTGYSYDKVFTTSSTDPDLNWATHEFFLRTGWQFAQRTQAGIELSASLTSYDYAGQNDTSSYSVGPYLDWQITRNLRVEARGGPTIYYIGGSSSGSSTALNSYYLNAAVYDELTRYSSQSVIVNRSVQLGLNEGSQYIEDFIATYALSWTSTDRTRVSLTATYEDGYQPLPEPGLVPLGGTPFLIPGTVNVTEHFQRYGAGPQITWLVTNHTSAILNYYYWRRLSNLPGRGYVDNSVTLTLNYSF